MATNAAQLAKTGKFGDLRRRLMFLLLALVVYRIGAHIPVPGIDPAQLQQFFKGQEGGILGMANLMSGGALSRFTVFALGIMPYISASIIMQLLTYVVPTFEQLKKERVDIGFESYSPNFYYRNSRVTAIYTADGDTARDFASRVNVGMVGINFPIPVPLSYFSFGGWKRSAFGDLNQYGPDAFRFYTKTKTVTARWFSGIKDGAALNFKALD